MSQLSIKVEEVSKIYRLGVINYGTLCADIQNWWFKIRGGDRNRFLPADESKNEFFHALKDVSFDVRPGEILGIVGRNGAGKSTLLKILSRITAPSSGKATINGRVASLLEVGTGFHPELTGRENVFLNGAILGMSRAETKSKFDEIVHFSEGEQFIDTPVKRYSSGMHVRLAFAVAAHLDPEVLILDEVLAVGDVGFQKKCLAKMTEVGRSGRTILFVSHNMTAVRNLCDRAIWLVNGRIYRDGQAIPVTDEYLRQSLRVESLTGLQDVVSALPEDPVMQIDRIVLLQQGRPCFTALNGLPVDVEIDFAVKQETPGLRLVLELQDGEGSILVRSFHDENDGEPAVFGPGKYRIRTAIPANFLAPRHYDLRLYGTIHNVRSIPPGGISIPLPVASSNGINRAYPHEPIRSKLQPMINWDVLEL